MSKHRKKYAKHAWKTSATLSEYFAKLRKYDALMTKEGRKWK